MKMKNSFYSIWAKVVVCCFWMMIFSFLIVGLTIHLMNQLNVWNLLPLPLTGLHFIFVLAIITTILGVFISMFIFKHALNPITQLSRSMQQVAEGNYNVKLDADPHKGEIHDLLTNFNHMVQELNSTETLHSDFISSVSHEFKTPLATISGYATLLQDDTLSAEERNEYINIIIRTTRELSHMTGNILSLSRLENQTIITDQESFHVDEQIRQCILLRETIWSEKNLVIDPNLDSIIWKGNRELTSHIWNNLLDNAIKFTPAGGEITVRASMDKDWLTVSFTDTGIGMTPEVKQRVFDKFYQGDTSHKKKGNGLGLALVRQIVTLYGGSVEVESAPDMGSTFTVRLPAHTISSESSSEQSALHYLKYSCCKRRQVQTQGLLLLFIWLVLHRPVLILRLCISTKFFPVCVQKLCQFILFRQSYPEIFPELIRQVHNRHDRLTGCFPFPCISHIVRSIHFQPSKAV